MERPEQSAVLTKQQRIAHLAREIRDEPLHSLSHHLDDAVMLEVFHLTRPDGAVGVDGVTAEEYSRCLKENLASLKDRIKSGERYRAPAVKRVEIPKADGSGRTRPLGIPTFEDKIAQKAIKILLEPVFEVEFRECSYGFRPERNCHQAVKAVRDAAYQGQRWVIDADIKSFFDTINHAMLREFIGRRVTDGVVTRMIGKWLKAGILKEGIIYYPGVGTPQGGVISPLLANVYLHYVLDAWYEDVVRPLLKGKSTLVRYADDFVILFEERRDAERVMEALAKRLEKYELALHPEKTRLIYYGPDDKKDGKGTNGAAGTAKGTVKPETFDFLGFTFYWGITNPRGKSPGLRVPKLKTNRKRLARALSRISDWLASVRHNKLENQRIRLCQKLNGHNQYYGVSDNIRCLAQFKRGAEKLWHKWLNRRNNKRCVNWMVMNRILEQHPLPKPRIYFHLYTPGH